jgi:hypothetical protein
VPSRVGPPGRHRGDANQKLKLTTFNMHGARSCAHEFLASETDACIHRCSRLTPHVLGDPPPARCAHSATLVGAAPPRTELESDAAPLGGDRILVYGGYGGQPLGDAWVLEVATPYVQEQAEKRGEPVVAWSRVEADRPGQVRRGQRTWGTGGRTPSRRRVG